MSRILPFLTNAFPLWVLFGAIAALFVPDVFTWFSGPWITYGLALIMLGMGITLTLEDFRKVGKMPKAVALGFVAQFTIMPMLGWVGGRIFHLDTAFAVGLILVACCPGGTASNVVAFLAKANVCLSVVMTMCSTFAAMVMTPLLTTWLAGTLVKVDGWGLFWSTVQVVIAPVFLGVMLNRFAPKVVNRVQTVAPLISVLVIAMICSSIVGANGEAIRHSALRLLGAVFFLHVGGFALGYFLARGAGFDTQAARTISIEVGMQNSGLGVVLARRHFADPLTAVPCAISSVFHSVIGSVLAGYWRWRSR